MDIYICHCHSLFTSLCHLISASLRSIMGQQRTAVALSKHALTLSTLCHFIGKCQLGMVSGKSRDSKRTFGKKNICAISPLVDFALEIDKLIEGILGVSYIARNPLIGHISQTGSCDCWISSKFDSKLDGEGSQSACFFVTDSITFAAHQCALLRFEIIASCFQWYCWQYSA